MLSGAEAAAEARRSRWTQRALLVAQLTQDQQQLTEDQHQLTQAVNQLARRRTRALTEGRVRPGRATAVGFASATGQLGNRSCHRGACSRCSPDGWSPVGCCAPSGPSPRPHAGSRRATCKNALALEHADDEFRRLGDTLDDLFARLEACVRGATTLRRERLARTAHPAHARSAACFRSRSTIRTPAAEQWRSTARRTPGIKRRAKATHRSRCWRLPAARAGLDHAERTDIAGICETVLTRACRDLQQLRAAASTAAIRPALLDGDPTLVERLVANLVDNAISHNVPDGHICIASEFADGQAVVSVTNTGPLIPEGEIDRLFQPFERLDGRRTHRRERPRLGPVHRQGHRDYPQGECHRLPATRRGTHGQGRLCATRGTAAQQRVLSPRRTRMVPLGTVPLIASEEHEANPQGPATGQSNEPYTPRAPGSVQHVRFVCRMQNPDFVCA